MGAEAAGKEPVAERHVKRVPRPHTGHVKRPGDQLRPGLEVAPRVADDGRLPGRAARCVHPGQVLPRHGEQGERIAVAQILLGGEGEARQICQRPQILRTYTRRVEFRAVGRDLRVGALERPLQAFQLQPLEFRSRLGPDQLQVASGVGRFRHLFILCSVRFGAPLASESADSSIPGTISPATR
jgi:hypothetical protein